MTGSVMAMDQCGSGWSRLCRATDASTVTTGINRLIRALETS
jgi:hypothetical protein